MQFRSVFWLSCLSVLFSSILAIAQDTTPSEHAAVSEALSQPLQVFHDGGIRDIDAIGTRNLGCSRSFGNWYGLSHQIAMGKRYSDRIESTSKLLDDPEVAEYVNRLGQELVRNSDAQVAFTIKVIDSDDINAFALPGGFFYVDSGLIVAADNEAELAGVMAHEIAHVAACHAARGRTRNELMNFVSIPLSMMSGPVGFAAYEAFTVSRPFTFMKFSRGFEAEADFLGIQYMYKAGYDPQALTAFFEKIKAMEKSKQNLVARAFETHPQTRDRIEKTQAEINTLLPPETEYKVDSSEFENIKAKLYHVQTHHQRGPRPTLSRTPLQTEQDLAQ